MRGPHHPFQRLLIDLLTLSVCAVVKIMYDRGNVKQIVDPHQLVPPEIYTGQAVNLPAPKEVPNLSIEVLNFHVFSKIALSHLEQNCSPTYARALPVLGTFHCKYLVVDRRVAVINSNNVQDRCNLEVRVSRIVRAPFVEFELNTVVR